MSRRLAAGIAAVLLVPVLVPVPAAADTVTINWTCAAITGGRGQGDYLVTVTAPATARVGQTVTITSSVQQPAPQSTHLAAGVIRATMAVNLSGASSSPITLTGLTNPEILPGTPWRISGGTGQVTFTNPGLVNFHPLAIDAGAWRCGNPIPPSPLADTTQVS